MIPLHLRIGLMLQFLCKCCCRCRSCTVALKLLLCPRRADQAAAGVMAQALQQLLCSGAARQRQIQLG